MMLYKYITKNVAKRHNKTVTFMPKPLFGDNGSGMHTHQSLWKKGKPLFAGNKYAGLSDLALHYIGGLLKHANALCAFASPTVNSYKRLTPGFEAPVNLAYSSRNRSAAIRIPTYSPSPKAKRIEYRPPDPSCNMYLTFSAMLMAGLDGIQNRIDPGEPMDKNLYELSPAEIKKVPQVPASLAEACNHLEQRPRVPAQRRRVHGGRHRHLAGDETQRAGPDPPASASVGIPHVLRLLKSRSTEENSLGPEFERTPGSIFFCVAVCEKKIFCVSCFFS